MSTREVSGCCPTCRQDRWFQLALGQVWLNVVTGKLYEITKLKDAEGVWASARRLDVPSGESGSHGPDGYCALWPQDIAAGKWLRVTNWGELSSVGRELMVGEVHL